MRNFAAVLFRPRKTMARILEAGPRTWHVWLLFALASLSGIFGDFDGPMLKQVLEATDSRVVLMVVGVLAGIVLLTPVFLWFYSYVPFLIGRVVLGGTGDIRGVRAALAWGLSPAIVALVYRVPAAFWVARSAATSVQMRNANVTFDPGRLAEGCGVALVFVLVELLVLVWCSVVMSNTLAEAHRYSAWHAFGTLVLAAIAPFIVVLAAALAMA